MCVRVCPSQKQSVHHSSWSFSIKALGFDLSSSELCSSWPRTKAHPSDFSSRSKGRSASILQQFFRAPEAWARHIEDTSEDVTSLSPTSFSGLFFFPRRWLASGDGESLRHSLQWKCLRPLPRVITSSPSGNRAWQQIGSDPAGSEMRFIHSERAGARQWSFTSLPSGMSGHELRWFSNRN